MSKCKICEKEYSLENRDSKDEITKIQKDGYCFNCGFWIEKEKLYNENTYIQINKSTGKAVRWVGQVINKKEYRSTFGLGCAGTPWFIHYIDGRLEEKAYKIYNSSWCQGDIPDYFLNSPDYPHLKVNAEVLTDKEYTDWFYSYLDKKGFKTGCVFAAYNKNGVDGLYLYNREKRLFYWLDENKKEFSKDYYNQVVCLIDFRPIAHINLQKLVGESFLLNSQYTEEEEKKINNPYRHGLL